MGVSSLSEIIEILNKDKITSSDILTFRRVVPENIEGGGFKVKENKFHFYSRIILKPGDVSNLDTEVETTIGRAIANRLLKIDPFGTFFKYDNKPMDINSFINTATTHLIKDELKASQIIKLINNTIWLVRFADMILPSLSKNVLVPPPGAVKLKKELLVKYKDLVDTGNVDFVDKVEKPLMEQIVREIQDDPSFVLYKSGKPSIGNNLKQSIGVFSPIFNPITGKYDIQTGSLMEGHNTEVYDSLANSNISGTYGRAVNTQEGGAMVKSIYNAMHTIQAAEKGTDCKSTKYKKLRLTKFNYKLYLWNYFYDKGVIKLLNPSNYQEYIGRILEFRSALYCMYDDKFKICNICSGEIPYKTNFNTIGLLSSKVGFNFVQSSLKSFHDSTVNLTEFDVFEYMKIEE